MSETITITGFKELLANLNALPDKVAQACERKATLAGALIVRNEAKRLFRVWHGSKPGLTGRTEKNIRARKMKTDSKWMVKYAVSISRYGMFAELGTKGHMIPKSGGLNKKVMMKEAIFVDNAAGTVSNEMVVFGRTVKHKGSHARPHLRPAFYNNIDRVIETERKVLAAVIAKAGSKTP